ncbi:MAG: CehA/McbA family metallohydrolase [Candidatus Aminicenantales bacterium]
MNSKRNIFLYLLVLGLLTGQLFGQVTLKKAQSPEDVPEAFRALWQKGDWIVSDGAFLALIGGPGRKPEMKFASVSPSPTAPGSILSFIPAGAEVKNEINFGQPVIRLDDRPYHLAYSSISAKPAGPEGAVILEFSTEFLVSEKAQAAILTALRITPDGKGFQLTSTITNTGRSEIKGLSFALNAFADTRYNFSPFLRDKLPRLSYRLFHKRGHSLAWVDLTPPAKGEGPQPGTLAPGQAFTVDYRLLAEEEGGALLGRVLDLLQVKSFPARLRISEQKGRLAELVVQDFLNSAVLYRDFLIDTPQLTLPLPEGPYLVTANLFPAVVEGRLVVTPEGENTCALTDPPRGKVKVKIQDVQGRYVPAKVIFIGLQPTRTPYFEPENPRQTEQGWETFKNSSYPPEQGQEVVLPAGVYLASASRGPESTSDQKVIEVLQDSVQELIFRLDRVLDTPGLIALDPHLHTKHSDGKVNVTERLRSIVGEGLEAAISTDHNRITDYGPDLKKNGLDRFLAVAWGEEVTASQAAVEFNSYPVIFKATEENNGAIPVWQETAAPLFREARQKFPGALLSLNHPRAGAIGYFNNLELDQDAAAFALDKISLDFDLLEVLNGPFYFSANRVAVEDWLHLLNRGRFFPLIGSSDSHSTDGDEPGYSRTYILYSGPRAAELDWAVLFDSLKRGKSFASNGPLLEFRVNGATLGETVKAKSGRADLSLDVRSAPWVSVDEVRLIINGERKIVFPVKTPASRVQKLSERISLHLERDAYLALEVLGRRTLYPVVQQPSKTAQPKDATLPYALSNPIFVDVDGNGRFDPPWPEPLELKKEVPFQQEKVPRK